MLRQKPSSSNNNSAKKRALSHAEIVQCERATKPVCDCRCGGVLHGANRAPADAGTTFFEQLPSSDPHHLQTREEKRSSTRSRRRQRKEEQRARERAAFFVEKARRRAEREAGWVAAGVTQ